MEQRGLGSRSSVIMRMTREEEQEQRVASWQHHGGVRGYPPTPGSLHYKLSNEDRLTYHGHQVPVTSAPLPPPAQAPPWRQGGLPQPTPPPLSHTTDLEGLQEFEDRLAQPSAQLVARMVGGCHYCS